MSPSSSSDVDNVSAKRTDSAIFLVHPETGFILRFASCAHPVHVIGRCDGVTAADIVFPCLLGIFILNDVVMCVRFKASVLSLTCLLQIDLGCILHWQLNFNSTLSKHQLLHCLYFSSS